MHSEERARPKPLLREHPNPKANVLLIHGFSGTTNELEPLAHYLYERGITVHAPLLAGHGTTPEDMRKTCWQDWWNSTLEGYETLKKRGAEQIVVAGLSMGGVLALKLAQHRPVQALVSLCTPMIIRNKRMWMAHVMRYVIPYIKRKGKKAEHIERHLFVYDRTPLSCVSSLDPLIRRVKRELPYIHTPALVIQAEQDETVDPCSARVIYERLGSKDKTLLVFQHSSHIITLDHEKEDVFEAIYQFILQQCVQRSREHA